MKAIVGRLGGKRDACSRCVIIFSSRSGLVVSRTPCSGRPRGEDSPHRCRELVFAISWKLDDERRCSDDQQTSERVILLTIRVY
jgi:hypothetical protein